MPDLIDLIADKLHELTRLNGGVSRGASDMRGDALKLLDVVRGAGVGWLSAETVPNHVKADGADMLLWIDGEAAIGHWSDSGRHAGEWIDVGGSVVRPTHCAVIVPPLG